MGDFFNFISRQKNFYRIVKLSVSVDDVLKEDGSEIKMVIIFLEKVKNSYGGAEIEE